MGELWVNKYMPKNTSEIQGQDKAVSQLKSHVENYRKGSRPIFVHGPPGTGKTSSIYAVANELNLEIVEVNASDVRNKSGINQIVGGAMGQQSLFSKGKIILVDEIDGLSGMKDRGGASALLKLAKDSSFPVVMTANDPYSQKLSKIRNASVMISLGNLNYLSIAARLRHIADAEGVEYDDDTMKTLARKAGGDMRAAINDLQALAADGKLDKNEVESVGDRKRTESIFNALVQVFKTTDADIARRAYDDVDADLDELFLWIENNIHNEYKKPMDLARAFDELSTADIFYGRIRRWQHFRFYVYCYDLLSAGIALSKDEKYKGFTKYQRSTKPLKIWRSNQKLAKKKDAAGFIAGKTHTSINQAMQSTIPFLEVGAKKNKKFARQLNEHFELENSIF